MKLLVYLKIWWRNTALSAQTSLTYRGASLMFVTGKFVRFLLFLLILVVILGGKRTIAEYSLKDVILVFLIFNFLDLLSQIFFRGIYWFRGDVVSGKFDLTLLKPINPIFQILTAYTDILDLPLFLLVVFWLIKRMLFFPLNNILLFIFLLGIGFVLALSIHILVASLGVITTEVDHAIMIYRDLSTMARVPIDIYNSWLRAFLIYIIPIGIIFTFPAKALMGILSWQFIIFSIFFSLIFLFGSLKLWSWSLKKYTSASS